MNEAGKDDKQQTDITFRLFELITDLSAKEQMALVEELEKKLARKTRRHKRRSTQLTVY